MCLGKNIRYLRYHKGMSQEELADYLGYKNYTTIQKWESGKTEPPVSTLKKMSELFNVSMEEMAKVDIEYKDIEDEEDYYTNPETRRLVQELYDNPERKILFDATRDLQPEDIEAVLQIIERMKR